MCFVASFVATVQRVVSAIKNPWFFGSQSQTVLPGKHSSEESPALAQSCSFPQCARCPIIPVLPAVKFTWHTLAKGLGKKTLLNFDSKPGRYTKTYSLLCYKFLKYLLKKKTCRMCWEGTGCWKSCV